jgi:lysozyme family protein
MKETYEEAIAQVYKDEGGYTNDKSDPGGPTNFGITIHDARHYWRSSATADDVKHMAKHVADQIYRDKYATPLHYNDLPAGVDYAVLDYGINSGIYRAAKVLEETVGVHKDGLIGPETLEAVSKHDPVKLINAMYQERLNFLQGLKTWRVFGKGWKRRCVHGRSFALQLHSKYKEST